jgi:hypothetical protein
VTDWTTGAHETPTAAELEHSWNSTVPESPPDVASANVACSCGSAFVVDASAGVVSVGVDGATLSIFQL